MTISEWSQKHHNTERFRGPGMLIERWTNAKSAFCGYHVARGTSSSELASLLNDGTTAESLRSIVKKWALPTWFETKGYRLVRLSTHKRQLLDEQARKRGMSAEEMLSVACDALIGDDLYDAVVDNAKPENARFKLSDEDVLKIRELLKTQPQKVVAECYGVSPETISKIGSRRQRGWVE